MKVTYESGMSSDSQLCWHHWALGPADSALWRRLWVRVGCGSEAEDSHAEAGPCPPLRNSDKPETADLQKTLPTQHRQWVINCGIVLLLSCTIVSQKPLPTASPAPGVKRLLVWESLWINWAMLSVLPWPAPRDPIMVDRTPCTIPVKSSGLRVSPPPLGGWGAVVGAAPEGAGGVACEGGGCWFGGGNTGWPDWKENMAFELTFLLRSDCKDREKH